MGIITETLFCPKCNCNRKHVCTVAGDKYWARCKTCGTNNADKKED